MAVPSNTSLQGSFALRQSVDTALVAWAWRPMGEEGKEDCSSSIPLSLVLGLVLGLQCKPRVYQLLKISCHASYSQSVWEMESNADWNFIMTS